jgi:monooxygenase
MFPKVGVVCDFLGHHYSRHFTPSYQPWDQRVCLLPNADLMQAIKANRASVVTDRIAGVALALTTESLHLQRGLNWLHLVAPCFRHPDIVVPDFTADSIVLESGPSLRADVVVTATG